MTSPAPNPAPVTTSDAERAALLPCPFCGGPATMIDRLSGPLIPGAFVSCDSCHISSRIRETLDECSIDWNRRPPAHPAAQRIDFKQATEQGGWQPIATAPKDGTVIDLWSEDFGRFADYYWGLPPHCCGEWGSLCDSDWHDLEPGWTDGIFDMTHLDDFTHWRLPPAGPAALKSLGVADGDAVGGKSGEKL